MGQPAANVICSSSQTGSEWVSQQGPFLGVPALIIQGLVAACAAVVLLSGTPALAADDSANSENSSRLEEIIVTAQKRSERIQDVPVPMTSLKADTLADTGQVLLRDYFTSVPGLTVQAGSSPGANTLLTIRGINSGGSAPTVGILIDDVPFGTTYGAHDNGDIPDIDPGDLDHVEVLRGPQGTLYGADSMGGLVKFVTVDPSTAGVSGRMEVGTNWV